MRAKKKRLIIISIIFAALLIMTGVVFFCISKHKAGQRYLKYEELEPTQIVLVSEYILEYFEEDGTELMVKVIAVDAEGNRYYTELPYEGWDGVQAFYEQIPDGEKKVNYISEDNITEIYKCLVQVNTTAEYYLDLRGLFLDLQPEPFYNSNFYGIRYREKGTMEYVKIWEQTSQNQYYILDDPFAAEIDKRVANLF